MKAMVLENPNSVENSPLILKDIPIKEPDSDEVRLKINTCGVCHTDLHLIEGELPLLKLPIVPGHEIIGIIDKIGRNVTEFKKGDRVGIPWLYSSCRSCKYCFRGQENLCPDAKFTGYSVNGGYAEYISVPKLYTYRIPDSFNNIKAAPLLCAGIIGYRSLKLSELKPGETLGIFGFGASAHIAIQVANKWDCETFVFTRSKNHQEHAEELGASWVGTSKDEPPKKIDRAIMFAPVGSLVPDVLKVLDKGGTLAINAIHLSDIPPISWDLLWHERKIVSVANTTRQDAHDFLKIATDIDIKIETHTYSLEQANEALIDMKTSRFNGAGVLKIK
ncbi:MAG: zinc-dependent alcohol dehydrogenase family protein [archaeon]|nr:zinc-dependent alcohol dehydrogenase family protein [archaeon]